MDEIELVDYDPRWPTLFAEEAVRHSDKGSWLRIRGLGVGHKTDSRCCRKTHGFRHF